MSDSRYVQKGFGLKAEIRPLLERDYHSGLVEALRESGNTLRFGPVEVRLAKEFGFCYGVDRAIDLAYETRRQFPDKTLYLTCELIHNPFVNQRMKDMGVRFLDSGDYAITDVQAEDVVLLPAFGVTSEDLAALRERGCILVDTTCGSVMNVWRRVRQYAKAGFTSVVHGKYNHEETLATCSKAREHGGHYLVVRDKPEAALVCDFMAGRPGALDAEALGARFAHACSDGFDPARDLQRVGVANQTTMLSSESLEIAGMLRDALSERAGSEAGEDAFRSFDTICSATQDRQDAIVELGEAGGMDLVLVIGGYNSSNTGHLVEIASEFAPSYHVDGAGALLSAEEIEHQPPHAKERVRAQDWLPEGELVVGVTAGASTPNRVVGEVIARVLDLRGVVVAPELAPQA